jgi:hypothetical protein
MRTSRAHGVTHGLGSNMNGHELYFGVTHIYVRVLVFEAVIITALWALGHYF